MSSNNVFDEDYFERGVQLGISGYTNYRWIPELTLPLCETMARYLGISKDDRILDFGCAKGYIVRALTWGRMCLSDSSGTRPNRGITWKWTN